MEGRSIVASANLPRRTQTPTFEKQLRSWFVSSRSQSSPETLCWPSTSRQTTEQQAVFGRQPAADARSPGRRGIAARTGAG